MRIKFCFAIAFICMLIATGTVTSGADAATLPIVLYGNITIDGEPAPVGTQITVKFNDTTVGESVIDLEGIYGNLPQNYLYITCEPENLGELKFYINNVEMHLENMNLLENATRGKPIEFDIIASTSTTGVITVNDNPGADYTSIQAAVNNANNGDTIIVYPGTYTENVDIGKELTIISQSGNPDDTIVQAADSEDHVFHVSADHVTISGFSLKGATYLPHSGIYLNRTHNSTVSNNKVSNNHHGIHLSNSNDNILNNNTVYDNLNDISLHNSDNNTLSNNYLLTISNFGVYLDLSSNNTLNNNTISNHLWGIYLKKSSNNALINNIVANNYYSGLFIVSDSGRNNIYNNYFNNTNNVQDDGTNTENIWNIIKTEGINIVGGSFLGGNFWAHPDGTGFSQTCGDADGDGICDSPYFTYGENIDYLPLSLKHSKPSALRTFPVLFVEPGEQFTVQMTVYNYGMFGFIEETLPPGFTFVDSTLADKQVNINDSILQFALFGDTSFEYRIKAADSGGTYGFSGIMFNVNKNEFLVSGDSLVRVGFHPMVYDINSNGAIDKGEIVGAIRDYFDDKITKKDVFAVIKAYFSI